MPGTKGHSGGSRAGAGRKPKPPQLVDLPKTSDPIEMLWAMAHHDGLDARIRLDALKALLPYHHPRASTVKPGIKRINAMLADRAEVGTHWEGLLT